jgi:hypothetical protein
MNKRIDHSVCLLLQEFASHRLGAHRTVAFIRSVMCLMLVALNYDL